MRTLERLRTPESIAYHEAAHAVIGEVLGLKVDRVTIIARRRIVNGIAGWTKGIAYSSATETMPMSVCRKYNVLSSLAGPIAEERYLGVGRQLDVLDNDTEKAFGLAPATCRSGDRLLEWIADLQEKARRLIGKHESMIRSVAITLLKRKTMSGDQVRAIMRQAGWKDSWSDDARLRRFRIRLKKRWKKMTGVASQGS